jgi:hypothetical protein
MTERNTQFLESIASIDKCLASPRIHGPVLLHVLLCLERIEKLLTWQMSTPADIPDELEKDVIEEEED